MTQATSIRPRIAFLPTYRFGYSEWCRKMHEKSVAALINIKVLDLVELPVAAGSDPIPGTGAVPFGCVHTLDEAEVAAAFLRRERVDALIVCPLDFGDERSVAKVAEILRVPILLYATKEPPADADASLGRVSDSYCGNLSIASGFYRRHLQFHFAGIFFPDEPALAEAVSTFASAVAVVSGLRGARLGQVGVRPTSFETVAYSEVELVKKFGQNVICFDLAEVISEAEGYAADDATIAGIVADTKRSVAKATVPESYYVKAARLEAALAAFWTREKLSVMGVQCWPTLFGRMGIEPCAVYGRLTGRGMLTACEADVLGGLSMLATYRAALGASIPHFIDWTVKHRTQENQFLAWHCGNAPLCLAADPSRAALRTRDDMQGTLGDRPNSRGGLFQFQLKPGDVTLCRLAEYDGRWKMLIASGRVVPSDDILAGTWSWVEVADHDRLYRTLVEEGFVHHASMVYGNQLDALRMACTFLDIQPVLVE